MKYRAIAEWSDGWWAVHVDRHPGVWTQARRLEQVAGQAADALSMALEVDVSPADIEVDPTPPVESAIVAIHAKALAAAAALEAATVMRGAAQDLTGTGMTVRDIGAVLGVSHQRAAVLAREKANIEQVQRVVRKYNSAIRVHNQKIAQARRAAAKVKAVRRSVR